MSLRQDLTRLGKALLGLFRKSKPLDARKQLAADIERTASVRKLHPIRFACRANELSLADTAKVERHYELVERAHGITEANRQAREYAGSLGKARLRRELRSRQRRSADPWDHTTPPAAA